MQRRLATGKTEPCLCSYNASLIDLETDDEHKISQKQEQSMGHRMKIAMIGTGYVGLVSGVCFSDFGHDVVCVDKDPAKIEMLERGEVPIFEPGLETLMAKNVEAGRLSFTGDMTAAIEGAEAIFIAVGTPTRRGDGHADLS